MYLRFELLMAPSCRAIGYGEFSDDRRAISEYSGLRGHEREGGEIRSP